MKLKSALSPIVILCTLSPMHANGVLGESHLTLGYVDITKEYFDTLEQDFYQVQAIYNQPIGDLENVGFDATFGINYEHDNVSSPTVDYTVESYKPMLGLTAFYKIFDLTKPFIKAQGGWEFWRYEITMWGRRSSSSPPYVIMSDGLEMNAFCYDISAGAEVEPIKNFDLTISPYVGLHQTLKNIQNLTYYGGAELAYWINENIALAIEYRYDWSEDINTQNLGTKLRLHF